MVGVKRLAKSSAKGTDANKRCYKRLPNERGSEMKSEPLLLGSGYPQDPPPTLSG